MGKTKLLQNTTSGRDVNPPDPASQLALGRLLKSADETEGRDSERDVLDRADVDRSRTARAVARGQSLPNGEWAIRNQQELQDAIKKFQNPIDADKPLSMTYGASDVQRHIIDRARELQMTQLLPASWGINMELEEARQKRLMLTAMELEADRQFLLTAEELFQESRFFSASIRRKYASRGVALPDGSFPIPDRDALRRAIRLVGKGGARAKSHIIKRAKALGAMGMLPSKWGIGGGSSNKKVSATAENYSVSASLTAETTTLHSSLVLDGRTVPYPLILEDKTTENGGYAKIKVPFFVGESVNQPPRINRKVRFPTRILQETVLEGNRQIAEGRKPLTVYARHARAESGNDLPVGGVVQLLAEGRIGYSVIDVVNEGDGKQIIALVKHKDDQGNPQPLLNSVSLRAGPNRFELEDAELNQEPIYEVQKLHIDGIDFAPDNPAMPTYGVQLLSAEESRESTNSRIEEVSRLKLTLEDLKTDHPALVEELVGPFQDEIAGLRQEINKRDKIIDNYKEKERRAALNDYVRELAGLVPEGEQRTTALQLFQEMADESPNRDAFSARVLPTFTRLLAQGNVVDPKPSDEERIAKLFPSRGGNGQVHGATIVQETVGGTDDENSSKEMAMGLEVPA